MYTLRNCSEQEFGLHGYVFKLREPRMRTTDSTQSHKALFRNSKPRLSAYHLPLNMKRTFFRIATKAQSIVLNMPPHAANCTPVIVLRILTSRNIPIWKHNLGKYSGSSSVKRSRRRRWLSGKPQIDPKFGWHQTVQPYYTFAVSKFVRGISDEV